MSSVFEDLQKDGKILAAQGRLFESLRKFEEARKIKETPKILQRIQKLKDFIAANGYSENTKGDSENDSRNSIDKSAKVGATGERMLSEFQKTPTKFAENKETTKVLYQIQNIEGTQKLPSGEQSVNPKDSKTSKLKKYLAEPSIISELPKKHIPENPKDLSPEDLKTFNELKKRAMELSYVGNFIDSVETFSKALQLCACPKVKKHYQDIKLMASEHAEKLHEVQNLTKTGKKLAIDGNQAESLNKLKDAYNVCPSPSISKMIKRLESQNTSKYSSEKGSIPFGVNDNCSAASKTETFSTESDDFEKAINACNDPAALSPEKLARFTSLYEKARTEAAEGKLQEALKALLEAKSICASNKILKRLTALQEHIKNSAVSDGEGDEMVAIADGFFVFHEIHKKLYPYQKEGVAWMWELFKKQKGGILGDDMGLGKTFQVIAFLSGLIDAEKLKHAIIIMPVSLLPNWQKEFKKWCPGVSVHVFHGGSKAERERSILRAQRRGHVLLTSYGMVVGNLDSLTQFDGRDFVWDYVILDEGHKIKNPTKTTKAVHGIPSKNRLVLTGTPVQNNLRELWALYDFTHLGTLLGSMKTFKMTYENVITRAREKDATAGEKRLGTEMADNLKKLISPYFLRRTKAEVWNTVNQRSVTDLENEMENLHIQENKLARKNDLIMWVYLSEPQCEIYENFLHSDAVKTILVSKRSPLVELTILKKICDHPRLLSRRACLQLGLNEQLSEEDLNSQLDDESSYSPSIENVSDETLIAESGKMKFLINLLEDLKGNGHRTLVFSLSRKILDMVHRILFNRNWKVLRIDGTIAKMEERERRIQLFQKDSSYPVFLLTTQVGGVGITLTAADRVIIYDPSWNPATDAQAVDRVYRIGQQKNVVVYRLITCGSVEEKIYRRQVFKDSITKQATGSTDPYRYFSKQELRELFRLDDPHHSATQVQLSEMHSDERQSDTKLDEHIAFLHSLNIFGISDHDLMFSKSVPDHSEDNNETAVSHDYIKKQVLMAQARIQDEAAVVEEGIRLAGSYFRPFSEAVQTFKNNSNKDYYNPPKFPEEIGNQISSTTSSTGLQLQSTQSSERKSYTEYETSASEKEKITRYLSKKVELSEINSSSPKISLNLPNKQENQSNISVIDINSDESDSSENENVAKSIKKEYSPRDKVKVNSSQFVNEHLSRQSSSEDNSPPRKEYSIHDISNTGLESTPIHKIVFSQDRDNTSPSSPGQSGDIVDFQKVKSLSEKYVSNQKDHSILSRSTDTSIQFDLHKNAKIEENSPLKMECVDDFVAHESMLEPHGTSISDNSDSEVFETNQKLADSVLAQSTDVPILLDEDLQKNKIQENSLVKTECNEPMLESDIVCSDDIPTERVSDSKAWSTDVPILLNEDLHKNKIQENSLVKTECNEPMLESDIVCSDDIPTERVSDSKAFSEYEHPATVDTLNFTEGDILPISLPVPASQNKSLFQDILETSTTMLSHNNFDFRKDSSNESSNILADLSFDEKPILKRNARKSCAKQQEFICESDSSYKTSCPSSLNSSYDESVPGSEDEYVCNTTADSTRSDIFDTSAVVPSSIPNSPFSSNTARQNKSLALSLSRRITPLRLRKSYVSPTESAFALAMAKSPVIDSESCQNADNPKTTLMDSMSEVDSPLRVRKKNRNIIVSESEDDTE